MKDKGDIIAMKLNMRPLEEAAEPVLVPAEIETVDELKNLPQESTILPPTVITKEANENLGDIELAKKNIENIINLGDESVREMVEIAKQSESPRAFEVVSTLMKTLLDANKDFVEMSTKKRYAKEEDQQGKTEVTNNNLIVSTSDLLKMIKGEVEEDNK